MKVNGRYNWSFSVRTCSSSRSVVFKRLEKKGIGKVHKALIGFVHGL